jgi:PAS domain S-box-containing protein
MPPLRELGENFGGSAASQRRVAGLLLVDDHRPNLLSLEVTLRDLDVHLVSVTSGEEALRVAAEQDFAAVLLDARMPGMSGLETIVHLRRAERSRRVPIILLTADESSDEQILQAYKHGAVDYMRKPFRPEVLRAKVTTFIELFRQQELLREQEAELQRRQRREDLHWFFDTLESLSDGFLAFDRDFRFTHLNGVAERMFGRERRELVGKQLWSEFPGLAQTVFGEAYQRAMREGCATRVEGYYAPFAAWLEARAFSTPSGLSVLFRDISERKRHEDERAALLEREQQARAQAEQQKALLELIIQQSGSGIIVCDAEGVLRIFNPAAEQQHGASHREVSAPDWARSYGLYDLDGIPLALEKTPLFRAAHGEAVVDARWLVKRPNGELRTLAGTATPLRQPGGAPAGAVLVTRDETEQQAQELQLRALIDNVPTLAWTALPDGHIDFYNHRWYEYTGTDQETMLKGWDSVHDPAMLPEVVQRWSHSLNTGESFEMEFPLQGADGVFRWFLTRVLPLRDKGGRIVRWFGTSTNIDDQRRMMESLRAAQDAIHELNTNLEHRVHERTAELQELNRELEGFTYSVSHDLRAPLRHITGFAQLLEARVGPQLDEKARGYVRVISEAAQRGGQLVDDLLAFSRLGRAELKKVPVDLSRMLAEVQDELAPDVVARTVTWNVGALPVVECDPSLLRAALKNLLSNALKYTRTRSEALISVQAYENEKEVEICVQDNGVGFDMTYVDKLFGVFQRLHTAEQFEGTGIGLANVRRIVNRHGGRVWARGVVEEGAAFHMTLPKRPVAGGGENS